MSGRGELGLTELQAAELAMLVALRDFCARKGLLLSLAGGTMLGAARHQGFIPWDDDSDVCLPRPDFNRLMRLRGELERETGYGLETFHGLPWTSTPLLRMVDRGIATLETSTGVRGSLWVDVLPVDGMPSDEGALRSAVTRADRLRRLLVSFYVSPATGTTAPKRAAKRAARAAGSLGADRAVARRLHALSTALPYGASKHVGILSWGLYGAGERVERRAFEESVELPFEGEGMPAMSCWDAYLHGLYGDYMTPPPPQERSSHSLSAWRAEGQGGAGRG